MTGQDETETLAWTPSIPQPITAHRWVMWSQTMGWKDRVAPQVMETNIPSWRSCPRANPWYISFPLSSVQCTRLTQNERKCKSTKQTECKHTVWAVWSEKCIQVLQILTKITLLFLQEDYKSRTDSGLRMWCGWMHDQQVCVVQERYNLPEQAIKKRIQIKTGLQCSWSSLGSISLHAPSKERKLCSNFL